MSQRLTLVGGRERELPALLDRPRARGPVRGGVVLAHGAGGTSQTPFIARAASGLAEAGWAVLRFDFGYAVAGGRPSAADRENAPERFDYRAALAALADALPTDAPVVAAGKSYGGRIATFLVASATTQGAGKDALEPLSSEPSASDPRAPDPLLARVRGVLVFGYPIGRPPGPRPADVEALRSVRRPILVVQGSRDSLGPLPTLEAALAGQPNATIAVVEGGDHSYRAAGGRQVVARLEDEAIGAAVEWLGRLA
jgi:predicted alpha/beta-hydrolase family hydrolase